MNLRFSTSECSSLTANLLVCAVSFIGVILSSTTSFADSDAYVQKEIERSIAAFPGECPCPYSKDATGNICGDKSAYLQPIHKYGYIPFCYPSDIDPVITAPPKSSAEPIKKPAHYWQC